MKKFLESKFNWWTVAISTLIFAVFIGFVLPLVSAFTEEVVGGLGAPDTAFFYTSDDLYAFAESYGQTGRTNYVILRWTFDLVWPLVYLAFLLSWTIQLAKGLKNKWLTQLYWLVIIATGFDYLENTLASLVMGFYPTRFRLIADLTPVASLLKWGVLSLAFGAMGVLLIARFFKSMKSVKRPFGPN